MRIKWLRLILIIAGLLLLVSTALAQSSNFRIRAWLIGNGGGQSSNGQFTLSGVIGQLNADSSATSNGRFTVASGFWFAQNGGPVVQNGAAVLLPLIARSDPPTPTPTPPAVWRRMDTNGALRVTSLAIQGNQLFVGTRDGGQGLYQRSLAACQPNVALTPVNLGGATTVLGIVFHDAEGIVAAYGDHLFYSNNNGQTWTQTGKNIDQPRSVAFAGNHVFFAGTENGGVYRSVNGGVDWGPLSETSQSINQLKLDSLDSNSLWIATNNNGVAKLTVNTERLIPINEGLSGTKQAEVWDFAFDSTHIYIATSDGVFFRGDRNTPWQRFGPGLAAKITYSLEIVGNQLLYAGTDKQGVWRRPLNESRDWEQVSSAGWSDQTTVNDLVYDSQTCLGLLAGTSNSGVWLYR